MFTRNQESISRGSSLTFSQILIIPIGIFIKCECKEYPEVILKKNKQAFAHKSQWY